MSSLFVSSHFFLNLCGCMDGIMVHMVTQNMLRTHEGIENFGFLKIRFVSGLDLIKCLKQIKLQRLLIPCAPISELPSNISNMDGIVHAYPLFAALVHSSGCTLRSPELRIRIRLFHTIGSESGFSEQSDPDPAFPNNRIRIRIFRTIGSGLCLSTQSLPIFFPSFIFINGCWSCNKVRISQIFWPAIINA